VTICFSVLKPEWLKSDWVVKKDDDDDDDDAVCIRSFHPRLVKTAKCLSQCVKFSLFSLIYPLIYIWLAAAVRTGNLTHFPRFIGGVILRSHFSQTWEYTLYQMWDDLSTSEALQ